ncbi:MAG: chloride channel protein [Myxococcota bacterium]
MSSIFDFRGFFGNINTRTIYLYSIAIGVLSGLGAVAFNDLLHWTTTFAMEGLARHPIPVPHGEAPHGLALEGPTRRWVLVALPVLGGLISGLLVRTYAPEAEGTGTDGYIDAFHNRGGAMRARVPLIKSLATLATLSFGGSAGKEGPTAQIGAGIGSAFGRFIHMGARARRTLMVAGAAAGLGAIFRAPLGGALTAVEVLYKEDLETDALTPAILASVTAYTIFCSIEGFDHVFGFVSEPFHSPIELLFYVVLGLVCSGVGYLYVRFLHGSRRHLFDRLPINKYLVPPIGGLMVGAIGYWQPQVLGQGFGYVQQLIDGRPIGGAEVTVVGLLGLAVLKIATTSFTISSGGSGGVFGPSIFIGAMLGGAVGTLAHSYFPELVTDVAPFVVVGMGAFFAGVANAPIASLLMVCELTGAYELLPPLMVVATVALVTSRRWSIYTAQVDNKFLSRAHLWEMNPGILRRITIGEMTRGVYEQAAVISNDLPLPQVEARIHEIGESDLVLKDRSGGFAGLLAMADVEERDQLEGLASLIVANDLVNRRPVSLAPEDNLIAALEFFGDREFDKLPIVDTRGGGRLLGYVTFSAILDFYKREHGTSEIAQAPPAPA